MASDSTDSVSDRNYSYDKADQDGEGLLDRLFMAAEDVLSNRDFAILDSRFGITQADGQTLQAIGQVYGLTGERIRQLQNRALRKLAGRGNLRLRQGRIDEPSAQLVTYVQSKIRYGEPGDLERIIKLAEEELPHLSLTNQALLLLAYLGGFRKHYKQYRRSVMKLVRKYRREHRTAYREERRRERFENLLKDIIWPAAVSLVSQGDYQQLHAQRLASEDSIGESGHMHSVKLQREVMFESGLERAFFEELDWQDSVVFYQEQPFKICYKVGASQRDYYPDVFFVLSDNRGVVVEIKNRNEMALFENWTKWTALKAFCRDHGYGFLIANGRCSLQAVGRRQVQASVSEALLSALEDGPLNWLRYKSLREEHNIKTTDLYALIIRHRLVWSLRPFWLGRRRDRLDPVEGGDDEVQYFSGANSPS